MIAQLVYVSRPFGFDVPTLNSVLVDARRNNRRDGLTGALICRSDIYLQLIEGPEAAIEATYSRIARDDRHTDVHRLLSRDTDRRLFPDWEMLDDPARSWLWSRQEVIAGNVIRASAGELNAVFERISVEANQPFVETLQVGVPASRTLC